MSVLELVDPCHKRCRDKTCYKVAECTAFTPCGDYDEYAARLEERNRIVGLISDNILLASLSYGGEVLIGWVMPDELWQALKGESDATK